jgi:heat shock protein HtpX
VNLYEQQTKNRRRTWLIMAGLVALLVIVGAGVDLVYLGGGDRFVPAASLLALAVGSASAAASYYAGARAVLASSRAQPLAEVAAAAAGDEKLKLRQLENVVEEMAIASGLPRPDVYIVPDLDPNAFATGRGPGQSSIAVTRGLLDVLNREELQGVVAHEMSHIRNLDVRLMTVVAAMVGTVALLADWARRMSWRGTPGRRGGGRRGSAGGVAHLMFFAVWLVAVIAAPLASRALAMMLSRRREYLADASAAELTRNPLGLAGALEKLDAAEAPTPTIHRGSAHLCIADPLGRQVNLREGFWPDLFASHPPMRSRIDALHAMALLPRGPV